MVDNPETPGSPGSDDSLILQPSAGSVDRGRFADRISRYLRTLNETDDEAETRQAKALDELRSEAGEAVVALAKAEASARPHDYPLRWALVYAATRMYHESALPYLRELILAPIPPPAGGGAHHASLAREETILRTTAIEGIGLLAERGNQRALEALFEFLDIDSLSVRRASIQAILAVDPDARDRIAERLPSQFHYLLDIRRAPVEQVPQIKNAEEHRAKKETAGRKPPPPELDRPASPHPGGSPPPKVEGK